MINRFEGFAHFTGAAISLATQTIPPERHALFTTIVREFDPPGIYDYDQEEQHILTSTRGAKPSLKLGTPWSDEGSFAIGASLASIMQFHDDLPYTVPPHLRPIDRINLLTNAITSPKRLVSLGEQYTLAMGLSDINPIAATYLLALTARYNCRGLDSIGKPLNDIQERMQEWYNSIGIFDFVNSLPQNKRKHDWGGNLYYFWTNAFAKLLLSTSNESGSHSARLIDEGLMKHATELMGFTRSVFARQPLVSRYQQSSMMGRKLGEKIFNICQSKR